MKEEMILHVRTPYGVFFIDSVSDKKMANALQKDEFPNKTTLAVAQAFVNKQSVVVDIGAHIGTFAIPIAKVARKVIAFEPSAEAFPLLSRNAKENSLSLQLINKALGSEKGSGTLLTRNTSNAGANTLVAGGDVSVVTLDDEVTHVDFIKIDVEGMELEVLRGGIGLIERARPVVLFEVNLSQLRAHGTSPRVLERFFIERGYLLYYPLEKKNITFARVYSMTLLTAFIAPRAWLFFGESAPFDLVAIPQERVRSYPCTGSMKALLAILKNNLMVKVQRVRARIR